MSTHPLGACEVTIDTYDRQASWIGPRYRPRTRVAMVVVPDRQDFLKGLNGQAAKATASTLVISVDHREGMERSQAAIVSCYRWLLAQLVEPDDVLIVGSAEFTDAMELVGQRLTNSGDPLPVATIIASRVRMERLAADANLAGVRTATRPALAVPVLDTDS